MKFVVEIANVYTANAYVLSPVFARPAIDSFYMRDMPFDDEYYGYFGRDLHVAGMAVKVATKFDQKIIVGTCCYTYLID